MTKRILIVDSDQAFATALQEQLREEAGLEPSVAASRAQAMQALREEEYDLVIVDMGVDTDEFDDDETRLQATMNLIIQMRSAYPDLRLMLIPLLGEELPERAAKLDIQGTLSKPFFLDDLLPKLERALSLPPPLRQSTPAAALPRAIPLATPTPTEERRDLLPHRSAPVIEPVEYPPAQGASQEEIRQALFSLVRDTGADAAVFVGPAGLALQEGVLDAGRADALAQQVRRILESSRQVSQFLEGAPHPLAHQILEGTRTRLCIQTLSPAHALAVLTPVQTSLGIVRVSLQRTSRTVQRRIELGL